MRSVRLVAVGVAAFVVTEVASQTPEKSEEGQRYDAVKLAAATRALADTYPAQFDVDREKVAVLPLLEFLDDMRDDIRFRFEVDREVLEARKVLVSRWDPKRTNGEALDELLGECGCEFMLMADGGNRV